MFKEVTLTNMNTGRTAKVMVDTDMDEKALIGAGKAANETAKVKSVEGLDESIQRITGKKASLDDRVALFRGVARGLDRNISTVKSFSLQANRVKSPRYRGAIAEISHQISTGEKVSDAMGGFPDLFGPEVLALMRAGEEAGQLPEVCQQVAQGQKKTLRIIKKLKAGMIYPCVVLVMSIGVIITMSFTLVPAVSKLYGSMGVDLPLATRGMMRVSEALIDKPYLALIPFVAVGALFKFWGRIYARPTTQKIFIKIPTVGNIVRKSSAAVVFRTLAMLLEANVRIGNALRITAEGAPHISHRTFFLNVRKHVTDGLSLPEAFLMESHWLGPDGRNISGLVEISAETGSSTDLLNEIADDYEEELDTIANSIEKVMEPFTILVLGTMVGFILYAIYSPIFGLGKVILPGKDKQKPGGELKPAASANPVPGRL
ncbi:type II secretion system F family protein [soil metagenome]